MNKLKIIYCCKICGVERSKPRDPCGCGSYNGLFPPKTPGLPREDPKQAFPERRMPKRGSEPKSGVGIAKGVGFKTKGLPANPCSSYLLALLSS